MTLFRFRSVSVLSTLLLLAGSGCSKEARKDRALERAERYYAAGELTKAEIEYRNVLQFMGPHPVALRQLGLIYQQEGRPLFAYPALQEAVKLDPDNADLRLKFAQAALMVGKAKDARVETVRVLTRQPTNSAALILLAEMTSTPQELEETEQRLEQMRGAAGGLAGYHLAWAALHFKRKDLAKAGEEIKQALTLDDQLPAAHFALANLHLLNQDLTAAEGEFKTAADLSPMRSGERLRYIDFKLRSGAVEEARKLLDELTARVPDYIPAWIRRMHLAFDEGKQDECALLARQVLSRDPPNFEALMVQARSRLAKGEVAEALKESERLAGIYPESPIAQHQLGLTQLLNQDLTKALASLNLAVTLDPNYADAVVLLAELNTRKGDSAAAVTSLTRFLKLNPEVVRARAALAEAYRVQGKIDDALAVYRWLSERLPKNPQPQFEMGRIFLQQRKLAEARQVLEKSRALAPNYMAPLELLVELDLEEKRPDDALQRVEREIEKEPKAAALQFLLGRVRMARNEETQAEAALLKTLELDASYRQAYLALARLYLAANKADLALAKLNGLIARNPKDVAALTQAAMIQDQLKKYDEARDAYLRVLTVNSNNAFALNNLAYLYSEQYNDLEKAFGYARRARDLFPNDPPTADTLGWINFRRGDYDWALTLLKESADTLYRDPEVLYHLGATHYMMAEEEPARAAFEKALALNKDFRGKEDATRRLAILGLAANGSDPRLLDQLEKTVSANPQDPIALSRLASVYERRGAYDQALKTYERALALNPKAIPFKIRLSQLYAEHFHDSAKALELAREARKLAPDDPNIAHALGHLAYQGGDHPWALSLLLESAQKLPQEPEVLYDLALASYAVGRLAEAQEKARQAASSTNRFARASAANRFVEMSRLAANPVQASGAESDVQKALEAEPACLPALHANALLFQQRGDLAMARKSWESILGQFPSFPPAIRNLAILPVEEAGDTKRALELARKARDLFPNDPEVAKALGIQDYRDGDAVNAARLLKESARQRPDDAELHYYLGLAHSKLKEVKESREALNKALALNPQAQFVPDATRVLASLKPSPP